MLRSVLWEYATKPQEGKMLRAILVGVLTAAMLASGAPLVGKANTNRIWTPAPYAPVYHPVVNASQTIPELFTRFWNVPQGYLKATRLFDGSYDFTVAGTSSSGSFFPTKEYLLPNTSERVAFFPGMTIQVSVVAGDLVTNTDSSEAVVYVCSMDEFSVLLPLTTCKTALEAEKLAKSMAIDVANTNAAEVCVTDQEQIRAMSCVQRCSNDKVCNTDACTRNWDACQNDAYNLLAIAAFMCLPSATVPIAYAICMAGDIAVWLYMLHSCNDARRRCENDAENAFARCVGGCDGILHD